MEEAVSAADATRKFSLLLRGLRKWRSYIVTSHGKPIARLVPADRRDDVAAGARSTLLSRLEKQPVIDAGRWTRDELYEARLRGRRQFVQSGMTPLWPSFADCRK